MFRSKVFGFLGLFLTGGAIAACSSGGDQGPGYLAGPGHSRPAPAPTRVVQQPYQAPPQRQAYYSPAAPAAPVSRNRPNCATERAARRPFPPEIVVQRGDNLCRIARRYQTTVQALVDANRLTSSKLATGMRLRLPPAKYHSQHPFGRLKRR